MLIQRNPLILSLDNGQRSIPLSLVEALRELAHEHVPNALKAQQDDAKIPFTLLVGAAARAAAFRAEPGAAEFAPVPGSLESWFTEITGPFDPAIIELTVTGRSPSTVSLELPTKRLATFSPGGCFEHDQLQGKFMQLLEKRFPDSHVTTRQSEVERADVEQRIKYVLYQESKLPSLPGFFLHYDRSLCISLTKEAARRDAALTLGYDILTFSDDAQCIREIDRRLRRVYEHIEFFFPKAEGAAPGGTILQ